MSTELVRMESNALVTLDGANDALARLARWVDAARNAHQLVAPLVGTAFVPDAYKPKIDPRATAEQKEEARQVAIANATAAVLQGLSLGLDPLVSLQQIYIVHGRPGMYAKVMVALVQAHGHEVWTEDDSDTRAVVAGRRRGSENIERVTVTMEQARKAGWTINQAYTKTPRDMLWSRAAARVCDRIASDVLKGIASVEEIQDELAPASNGTRTVTPARRRAAVARALGASPAVAEPPLDADDVVAEEVSAPAEPEVIELELDLDPQEPEAPPLLPDDAPVGEAMVTQQHHRAMHALWRDLGYEGEANRLQRLEITGKILRREIESSADLTADEADTVIARLRERKNAQAAAGDDAETAQPPDAPPAHRRPRRTSGGEPT